MGDGKKKSEQVSGAPMGQKKKKSEQVSEALMGKKFKKKNISRYPRPRWAKSQFKNKTKQKNHKNRYPLPRWARIWGAKGGTAGIRGPDGLRKKKLKAGIRSPGGLIFFKKGIKTGS